MNERCNGKFLKRQRQAALCLALCFLSAFNVSANEQPVQAFKITEYDGFLALRYLYDDYREGGLSTTGLHETRPTYQQEFSINSKGYAYHPNFLSLEMGASLILDQSRYETDQETTGTDEELSGFNLRMDFLKKKPYPFSFYYNKSNPSISTGLSGQFIQENTKYGADFALLSPLTPVQVTLNAFKEDSKGEGFEQVIDDHREQVLLKLNYTYGSGNSTQLTMQHNYLDTQSGSADLPIFQNISTTNSISLDTRNLLGSKKQITLTSVLTSREREDDPFEKELTFSPRLSWTHSDSLSSFYSLNYTDYSLEYLNSTGTDLQSEKNQINAGLSFKDKNMTSGVRVLSETSSSRSFDYQNDSLSYDISRQFQFDNSTINLSYKGSFDNRDQQATSGVDYYSVYGEQHTLNGTTPVYLSRSNIIINDPMNHPFEAWNENRTQSYTRGADYELIEIGDQVQIQRLVGGSILDGQVVLVDYDFLTGGTFAYDMLVHNVTANWNINKRFEIYTRYRQSDQELNEGTINSISLSDLESLTYGVKADKPLLNGMLFGAEYYKEDVQNLDQQGNDISSYVKDNFNFFVEMSLSRQTDIHFSGRRVIKNYESSTEGSDLHGYIVRIKSRPALRVTSSLESSYEKDTGGSQLREQTTHRLRVNWKLRQLQFNANVLYTDERLGTAQRERWEAKMELRRDFF